MNDTKTKTNATQIAIVAPNDMPLSPREQKALELAKKHWTLARDGAMNETKAFHAMAGLNAIIELLGGEQG